MRACVHGTMITKTSITQILEVFAWFTKVRNQKYDRRRCGGEFPPGWVGKTPLERKGGKGGKTKRDRAGRVEDDRASSLRQPIQCARKLLQIFESA